MAKLGPEEAKRAQMLLIDTYRESHEIDRAIAETQKAMKEPTTKIAACLVTYAILLGEKSQTEEAEKVLRGLLQHNAERSGSLSRPLAGGRARPALCGRRAVAR